MNLSAQINGTFEHKICNVGPNCFVYKFNPDGTFEYQYHQDIIGNGTLDGTYSKVGDTLKLFPNKVLFEAESIIIEKDYGNSDSTRIEIKFQRLAKKGESDIVKWDWYVSINDTEYRKTDENGIIIIPKVKVEKIQIRDILKMEIKSDLLKLTDSIFKPKMDKNSITIYASESEDGTDLAITDWMTKVFLKKGKKLFPLTFEPEMGYLGNKKTYYRRIN